MEGTAVKTVPTLRVVSKSEAPAGLDLLGVTDLPAELRVALTEIAGAARDGLLAMSVAAGLAVMQAMFDAEITAACGSKGVHDPDRAAVRHGAGQGSVVLGGRRVPVRRPRGRWPATRYPPRSRRWRRSPSRRPLRP